jgi:hypothetical protein
MPDANLVRSIFTAGWWLPSVRADQFLNSAAMPTNAHNFRALRIAATLLASAGLFAPAGRAQPFRITTWQVPDVPSTKGATNPSAAGPDTAAEMAATLSGLEADAILLYGISDGGTLKRLGDLMKPKKHAVALHVVFRHGGSRGPIVGEPFAILSSKQRMHAKTIDWADSGRIDFPGGFAFATFKHGPGVVAVYVASLPGGLTNLADSKEKDYVSGKRNYAAQFVSAHIGWLATTYTNPVFATYLTGDMNPSSKRVLKDESVSLLERAGFRAFLLGTAADKSGVSITNSQGLDRVLDPVFTRNVEFIASRQVPRPAPEHPIVVCDLTLKAPGVATLAAPPAKRAASSSKPASAPAPPKPAPAAAPASEPAITLARTEATPAPEKKPAVPPVAPVVVSPAPVQLTATIASNTHPSAAAAAPLASGLTPTAEIVPPTARWPLLREQWFAPVMAAGGAVLMAAVFFFAHATRRRRAPLAVTPRPGDAVFVEVGSIGARPEGAGSVAGEQAIVSEATTSTDNAHNVHRALWRRPRIDFGNQEHADPVRAGLLAHLRHLMRDKLFAWLSQQRTQLIDSHEEGTRQVIGLEERLEKIREQFQDRLISQEERIAALDRELQAKEKVIRETVQSQVRQEERPSNGH